MAGLTGKKEWIIKAIGDYLKFLDYFDSNPPEYASKRELIKGIKRDVKILKNDWMEKLIKRLGWKI